MMGMFVAYLIWTLIVLYRGMSGIFWEVGSAVYLIGTLFILPHHWLFVLSSWMVVLFIVAFIRVEVFRNAIFDLIFKRAVHAIPTLSKTEEEALNAGDTWLEQDIFTGTPNWQRLFEVKTSLSEEEQAFLDHETTTLCSMLNEWEISQARDLPVDVWNYLKSNGFFGLVIAKEYGGKGFSARAHSDIILKIASRCGVAAVTAMVPNSLGPGELLQHYGTSEQKENYLPKLAKGIEIPCFALTEPGAGSDATSIRSEAIVIEKMVNGQKSLALELKLNKRWITLSPVATLVGLAVNLKDPNGLLAGIGKPGITCLLIPANTKNLVLGNRHLPADQPFMNGTIRGKGVVVPIGCIIGGQEMAGQGWQMLVECLSIGRSISLPTLAAASSSISYLTSGAYARIRQQFNVEIGQFEGIEEKLAEVAGLNYIVNATRLLTLAAVDAHKKPSVASAITKYFNTELARIVINDAMDIHAGRAVVVGPRNYLSNYYHGIPISVTVEGANIMTRNLLIFGQGSMACHPFVRDEFYAVSQRNKEAFRGLLWRHMEYFLHNLAKSICSAWTGGLFIKAPKSHLKRDYKRLTRLSHAFSFIADFALMYLGGGLKRKERLSARLADGMSYLYLAMAVLRDYQTHEHQDDRVHARWALDYCFYQSQHALITFCQNFPSRFIGVIIRALAFPFGQTMRYPSDNLSHQLARIMTNNNHYRDTLCQSVYLSGDPKEPVDKMEYALQLIIKNGHLYKKIGDLKRYKFGDLQEKLLEKVKNKELSQEDMDALILIEKARWDAIQVDEFTSDSMKNTTFSPVPITTDEFK